MSTFLDLMDGVATYYGSGSDEWVTIARGGVTPDTIPILQQVPGVSITRSASGAILGYDYSNPFSRTPSPASAINSNVQSGTYGLTSYHADIPANAITDPVTGTVTMQSGSVVTSSGNILSTIADRASLAVAGVALGTKLGIAIDSALYAINPDWWDEHFPAINPATWETIAGTSETGRAFIRSLVGLENDQATMYMDERVLAYAYMMLLDSGAFTPHTGGTIDYDGDTTGLEMTNITLPFTVASVALFRADGDDITYSSNTDRSCAYLYANSVRTTGNLLGASLTSEDLTVLDNNGQPCTNLMVTVKGQTLYYAMASRWGYNAQFTAYSPFQEFPGAVAPSTLAYLLLFGTYTPGPDEGIIINPNAGDPVDPDLVINPTTGDPVTPADDPDDVLAALRTAYPALFAGSIYENVPQEDGTVQRVTYIPAPYPDQDSNGNPVTNMTPGIDPQLHPEIDPATRPDAAQSITDATTTPPSPPDTGSGEGPLPVIPSGSANALYSIYNPTQGELSSFGAWLWSSSFVDQLLKLFSDPMQAIIGLHKVFCTPPVSGRGNIKVGYLDSGVACNLVSGQYVTIPCGSVSLPEYFGNVFDYDPYTRVSIYLPFVGIETLDTGDVMRGTLTVTYHVDVLTGACLAEVEVTRDSAGGILYTYAGNAAVQYPVSSGSYMGILSTVVSVAGGIAGTIASGGALAPLAMGAAGGMLSARTRVQHSGGFSGNAGAMGARVPYLIITRPQSATAQDFPAYEGYPANHTVTLGQCSGFVRVKVAHLDGLPATRGELDEIARLLADGVIV